MATYTVQAGDTLSAIAKKFLGSSSKYPELAQLNQLDNPKNPKTAIDANFIDCRATDKGSGHHGPEADKLDGRHTKKGYENTFQSKSCILLSKDVIAFNAQRRSLGASIQ